MTDLRGSLDKLTITAYKDELFSTKAGTPNCMSVMVNPASYSRAQAIDFAPEQAIGADGKSLTYNRTLGESLSFDLWFDGTGTVPNAPTESVKDQITLLRRLTYEVNGKIHTPNYLILNWGDLVFRCRLKSLTIDYKLFAPDGKQLRAKATAGFVAFMANEDSLASENRSSPDLTHAILVEAGDTLPLLCHQIYRDSRYYLAVAAHNGLDNFRVLTPGTMLLFPPLAGATL
jgi:hypothetical protein